MKIFQDSISSAKAEGAVRLQSYDRVTVKDGLVERLERRKLSNVHSQT